MTDHAPFIEAICAHPDDMGPRLVYADWLDEQGDERGEFIQTQIELAQGHLGTCTGPGPDYCWTCERLDAIRQRGEYLFQAHKNDWLPRSVQECCIFGGASPEAVADGLIWQRGFIEELTTDWQSWRHRGDLVRLKTPLRVVRLVDPPRYSNLRREETGEHYWFIVGESSYADIHESELAHQIGHCSTSFDNLPLAEQPRRVVIDALLAKRWPGLKFEYPINMPAEPVGAIQPATVLIQVANGERFESGDLVFADQSGRAVRAGRGRSVVGRMVGIALADAPDADGMVEVRPETGIDYDPLFWVVRLPLGMATCITQPGHEPPPAGRVGAPHRSLAAALAAANQLTETL